MSGDYLIYDAAALVTSFLLTVYLTVPFSTWLAGRVGAIDLPGDLKVHSQPIPRLGGMGIMLSFLVLFIVVVLFNNVATGREVYVVVGSTFAIFLLGVADDTRGLPQTTKFVLEGLIALGLIWMLADSFTWWLALVAWLWLVGLTNAYNFIDGLDGLAGGIAAINLIALSVLCLLDGMFLLSLLALACAGACLGFLRLNWQPARVFMGDGGALGIGFLIASLSILYINAGDWNWNRIVAVLLVAALPVADVTLTFIRRAIALRSLRPGDIFPGDRFHFYDQMQANAGLSTMSTVLISYRVGSILAAFGIVTYFLPPLWAVLVGLLGIMLLILLAVRYKVGIPRLEETEA